MKKRVVVLFASAILLMTVAGCGKKEDGVKIDNDGIEIFHNDSDTDVKIEW